MEQNILSRTISDKNKLVIVNSRNKHDQNNHLSTCVPTHKVIQNKNKYIAHNTSPLKKV